MLKKKNDFNLFYIYSINTYSKTKLCSDLARYNYNEANNHPKYILYFHPLLNKKYIKKILLLKISL